MTAAPSDSEDTDTPPELWKVVDESFFATIQGDDLLWDRLHWEHGSSSVPMKKSSTLICDEFCLVRNDLSDSAFSETVNRMKMLLADAFRAVGLKVERTARRKDPGNAQHIHLTTLRLTRSNPCGDDALILGVYLKRDDPWWHDRRWDGGKEVDLQSEIARVQDRAKPLMHSLSSISAGDQNSLSLSERSTYYADYLEGHFGSSDRDDIHSDWDRLMHRRWQQLLTTDYLWDETAKRRHPQPHILTNAQCPYCLGNLQFFGQPDNEPFVGDQSFAGECERCGWWFCESMHYTHADHQYSAHDYYEGVLRTFDLSALDLPLELLRHHLSVKFPDVRHIHPRKFEELCASLLGEHFDCEVRLTGYSRDGGIDIYLIDGEKPWVVQVKRRGSGSSESVQAIRAFLGAMVQHGITNGLYVSTADRFSPDARDAANSPNVHALGLRVDLIDYGALRQLFVERQINNKPWKTIAGVREPRIRIGGQSRTPRFAW